MADEPGIPLTEAVRALRQELAAAVQEGEGEDIRFKLDQVELEFQVQVARQAGATAGITFWVVSIGGSGSRTSGETHIVRLRLTPLSGSGDEDVLIGSEEAERPD